ncbi:YciE/YciF ferroxidase family protein [Filimonas effusa]|uniref:DUF892 family protein n=1 Tax=Filimonas effusa TaxID=2508721 RepID=A0A4V1MAI9_9BACT|nr:DUF892 family protein [Filimonas effusa]RXK86036.1 DUF892 family protein [Filimonas effusa]
METVGKNASFSRLEEFFRTMLQEIYWSEQQLANVLATMRDHATNTDLKRCFSTHIEQTQNHGKLLEDVFRKINQSANPEPSAGLQGLFDEGWQVIDETEEGTAQRDVALIIAAQKVEHYEIACYGSLATLARTIGEPEIASVFENILSEEKETDLILTGIAEEHINYEASKEPVAQV